MDYTDEELAEAEKRFRENYEKKYGVPPDIIEYDDDGWPVSGGSHADYDSHALDVQNDWGYYNENGHYIDTGLGRG